MRLVGIRRGVGLEPGNSCQNFAGETRCQASKDAYMVSHVDEIDEAPHCYTGTVAIYYLLSLLFSIPEHRT